MSSTTRLSLSQIAVLSALMVEARELTNAELAELAGAPLTGEDRKRLVTGGLIDERRVGRTFAFQLSAKGWSSCVEMLATQARGKGTAASAVGTLLTGLSRALSARGADARSFFGMASNGSSATYGGPPNASSSTNRRAPSDANGSADAAGKGAARKDAARKDAARKDAARKDAARKDAARKDAARRVAPSNDAASNGAASNDPASNDAARKPVDVEERIRTAYQKLATEPAGWVSLADLRDLLDGIPRPDQDAALKRVAVQAGVRLIPVANLKSLTSRDRAAAVRFGGEDNHALAIEAS